MKILNLTQHTATPEQAGQGVFEPIGFTEQVKLLLTFEQKPTQKDICERARKLAAIAAGYGADYAMIGGAPYLMSMLEHALEVEGIKPLYAFSLRMSEETTSPEGVVTKTNVFKHIGFVGL